MCTGHPGAFDPDRQNRHDAVARSFRIACRGQALANDFDDFQRGKEAAVISAALEVKDVNDLILQKLLDDQDLRERATFLVMYSLYDRYNGDAAA